jgi:1-acyl-sn-glycerol-3-phosphate acyltransferase
MKILRAVHTAYALVIFAVLFVLFFPLLLIPILFKKQFHLVGIINRWWARSLFILCGLPFRVTYRMKLDPKKQYIFCPNHFSYADIPTMGLNHLNTIFVGKNDMENIPLFGFMYRQLHITVDRERLKSRYSTMLRTFAAIDEGKSLVIFPEGGIVTEKDPVLHRFKDGAFRAAIEKQIPIVPVTIPHNWIILPPNEFLLRWKPVHVIFHEPIDPRHYSLETIEKMKAKVRDVIENELKNYLPS